SLFDKRVEQFRQMYGHEGSSAAPNAEVPLQPASSVCRTQVLFLVLYGGNLLDYIHDAVSRRRDMTNLQATFNNVIQSHYQLDPTCVQFRLVACPNLCKQTLSLLSRLSLYNTPPGSNTKDVNLFRSQNFVPLEAVALIATGSSDYREQVNAMVMSANRVYNSFLQSPEGKEFTGQVCLLADAVGSLFAYDALTSASSPFRHDGSHCSSQESLESSSACPESGVASMPLSRSSRKFSLSDPNLVQDTLSPSRIRHPERSKSQIMASDVSKAYHCSQKECKEKLLQPLPSQNSLLNSKDNSATRENVEKAATRRTSGESDGSSAGFDFDVSDFFMCGAPLGMILAYRNFQRGNDSRLLRPNCHQVYNMFHSNDPTAKHLEPLLHDGFSYIPPVNICRYSKFPLGDGEPVHVVETVQKHLKLFTLETREHKCSSENIRHLQRQNSFSSLTSTSSGLGENTVASITNVTRNWWGVKRVDYVLYCPEVLHTFPTNALPHLFHASFWESLDMVAFILRQVLRQNEFRLEPIPGLVPGAIPGFKMKTPREKWIKRRTTIKVRNLQPNHRANDVIVLENTPQLLTAKFVYGSLDIASLSGEKVDVNIMKQPPTGDWALLASSTTDSHGRFSYLIPEADRLPQGMYPVKLVVRGDHTYVDLFLTVLPPKTETVVFSIDGSFTASVSITGKNPKVRAGAVDVVRQWQDRGYLILYVSARPDLQHRKVVTWLTQHNFPHGIVAFMDGLSKDPLKQKFNYIKSLQTEAQIELKAAYGSSKDVSIYKDLGLQPNQIFIVGKVSRKQFGHAQILSDGYSAHLIQLTSPGFLRPAVGGARFFLQKSNFRLSTYEHHRKDSKKSAWGSLSNPPGHISARSKFKPSQTTGDNTSAIITVQDFSTGT
ncbi:unnamed protein product, partial [Candidula unifasciata]